MILSKKKRCKFCKFYSSNNQCKYDESNILKLFCTNCDAFLKENESKKGNVIF